MLVQTFGAEAAIERLDERIVSWLARPRTVEHNAALIGPEVHFARDELAALIDTDCLGVAGRRANPVEGRRHVFGAIAVLRWRCLR